MNKLPYIRRGSSGGMDFSPDSKNPSGAPLFLFLTIVGICFIVMILRLFQLTIVKGTHYRSLAEENRIREIVIEPKRGTITDRKGVVLAQNFDADLNAKGERLPSRRSYSDPEIFAHLIGYRQIGDKNDLDHDVCINKLKSGFKVGKKGAEKLFECTLRGDYGKKLIEVDAAGKLVKTLTVIPPKDGITVKLAVDAELQKKAYDLIKDKKAVVVGMRPQTGEVLILASSPSFDPQVFEDSDVKTIESYFKDENKPLFNRATEGTYPPGSTFKITIAAGALQEKAITPKTQIEDTGEIQAGPTKFGNWYFIEYGKKEGMLDIVKGIRRSNDIFFYKTGEALRPERIKKWATIFGYGHTNGIGLAEAEGTVPSPFWKADVLKEQWYTGDTYNLSIGQGYLLATPLQVALSTMPFANGGYFCQPRLLKIDQTGNLPTDLQDYATAHCEKVPVSQEYLDLVRKGMTEACSTGGTGYPLFDFKVNRGGKEEKIQVACKTGTAESHGESKAPHAWITVYAPADPTTSEPEIVLTVLVEEGGQGSDVAGPIARDILKAYFERTQ